MCLLLVRSSDLNPMKSWTKTMADCFHQHSFMPDCTLHILTKTLVTADSVGWTVNSLSLYMQNANALYAKWKKKKKKKKWGQSVCLEAVLVLQIQYVICTPIGSTLDVRAAVLLWDCGPKLCHQRLQNQLIGSIAEHVTSSNPRLSISEIRLRLQNHDKCAVVVFECLVSTQLWSWRDSLWNTHTSASDAFLASFPRFN